MHNAGRTDLKPGPYPWSRPGRPRQGGVQVGFTPSSPSGQGYRIWPSMESRKASSHPARLSFFFIEPFAG